MKSASYYQKKARAAVELGQWEAADQWKAKAAEARKRARAKK